MHLVSSMIQVISNSIISIDLNLVVFLLQLKSKEQISRLGNKEQMLFFKVSKHKNKNKCLEA